MLKKIPTNLGFELFIRQNNRLILSDKGKVFSQKILPTLNELEQLEKLEKVEIPALRQKHPILHISMSSIFEQKFFKLLFNLKHNLIHFNYTLTILTKAEQLQLLRTYKIDLILVVLNQQELLSLAKQNISTVPFKKIRFNAYISKKSLNTAKTIENILYSEKIILLDSSISSLHLTQTIRLNSYLSIFNAICSGIGYGFAPSNLLEEKDTADLICIDEFIKQKLSDQNSYFAFLQSQPKKSIKKLLDSQLIKDNNF